MTIRLSLIVLVLALNAFAQQMPPVGPGVSHDLALWRAEHYSDVRYKLNLTLEKMSPVLKGTMEIRVIVGPRAPLPANAGSSGVATPIILDWRRIAGHEKDSTISNVSINGVAARNSPPCLGGVPEGRGGSSEKGSSASPCGQGTSGRTTTPSAEAAATPPKQGGELLGYEETNEHLIFRDGVKPGENVIKLHFTSPILTSGSAITRYLNKKHGGEYIYSRFVPSDVSTAFPVFDQPDLKATFSLHVTFPLDWKLASNREVISEISGSIISRHLRPSTIKVFPLTDEVAETEPISIYDFAFAAGPAAHCLKIASFCPKCVITCNKDGK